MSSNVPPMPVNRSLDEFAWTVPTLTPHTLTTLPSRLRGPSHCADQVTFSPSTVCTGDSSRKGLGGVGGARLQNGTGLACSRAKPIYLPLATTTQQWVATAQIKIWHLPRYCRGFCDSSEIFLVNYRNPVIVTVFSIFTTPKLVYKSPPVTYTLLEFVDLNTEFQNLL